MLGQRRTPYHRFGVWVTRFVPGVYFMRYVWTPIDRLAYRLRGGRHGIGPRALPFMMLTTIGRTTGLHRSTPVLYLQDGPSYAVVGSNYGRRGHPAWTHNLIATPQATVQIGEWFESVLARRATPDEFERYWPRLTEIWPGWHTYRKMTEREFRMFVLEPAPMTSRTGERAD